MIMIKPTLCLDFDGVLHSYESGWVDIAFIPDPPVPGAMAFLVEALDHFKVVIYSSRSNDPAGLRAMVTWLRYWAERELSAADATKIINQICNNTDAWPASKPSAFVTLDDRAIQFHGDWPGMQFLLNFKPWNKQ